MEIIPGIDRYLVVSVSKYRLSGITTLMKLMTKVGDGYVWGVICIVIAFINFNAGVAFISASVLQVVLQQMAKHIFCRQRPFAAHDDIFYIIPPPDKFSFPSGHTVGAFVMVFAMFHFFPVFLSIMIPVACLIAISRVYLGLHYPTDILGGILLGYISSRGGLLVINLLISSNILI